MEGVVEVLNVVMVGVGVDFGCPAIARLGLARTKIARVRVKSCILERVCCVVSI